MVLPVELVRPFYEQPGYGCTVSNFEQYTLARFIREGHFEHINRMRTHYRKRREKLLGLLRKGPLAGRPRSLSMDQGFICCCALIRRKRTSSFSRLFVRPVSS